MASTAEQVSAASRVMAKIADGIGHIPVDGDVIWASDAKAFARTLATIITDTVFEVLDERREWARNQLSASLRSGEKMAHEVNAQDALIADLANALTRDHESVKRHSNLETCETCELLRRALDRSG